MRPVILNVFLYCLFPQVISTASPKHTNPMFSDPAKALTNNNNIITWTHNKANYVQTDHAEKMSASIKAKMGDLSN